MPTVVDSLVVLLGLDAKGMEQGAKDAEKAQNKIEADANKSADAQRKRDKQASESIKKRDAEETKAYKEQEVRAKKLTDSLDKIHGKLIAIGAAYLGARAIGDITAANAETGRKSQTFGVGVSDLKAQEGAAKNLGASMEDLDDILRNINKTGQDATHHIITSVEAMNALYMAADDANKAGAKVDMSKYFAAETTDEERQKILRQTFSHLNAKDAAYYGGQAGFSESQTRILQIDQGKWDEQLAKQKKLISLNEKNAQASADLKKQFNELEDGVEGVANDIVTDLNPALSTVITGLQGIVSIAKDSPKTTAAVVTTGTAIAGAFSAYKVFKFISAVKNGIGALAGIGAAADGAATATTAIGVAAETAATTAGVAATGIAAGFATMIGGIIAGLAGLGAYGAYLTWKASQKLPGTGQQQANALAGGVVSPGEETDEVKVGRWGKLGDLFGWNKKEEKKAESAPATPPPAPTTTAPIIAPAANKATVPASNAPPEITQAAQASQNKYGIPAEVTIAQWKLESASGTRMPEGSNNPFGIKAKAGEQYVEALTTEFINGIKYTVIQRFKKFDSIAQAFDEHAKLLANGKAYSEARKHTDDPKAFADALTGKYATDPLYGEKLKKLMQPGPAPDKGLLTGASASAAKSSISNSSSSSTSTTQVSVGQVTVNTKATDAPGISKDIGKSLQTYVFASNANTGLS